MGIIKLEVIPMFKPVRKKALPKNGCKLDKIL